MNNTISSSISDSRGWTASPNERGTFDIITSCIFTIILCIWTSVCPNVPALSDRGIDRFRDKFDLAFIALLGPDFLLCVAVGQRSSARRSVKKFRATGYEKWTLTHAFYADMGGFVLNATDLERPIALNAEQLYYLVVKGYVEYPKIDKEDIDDRNKVDGLSRLLTVGQALWFVASSISRPIQGLSLTALELTALSFVLVLFATSFCWFHKPSNITRPIVLVSKCTIEKIRFEGGCQPDSTYYRTPLDFVGPEEYTLNLIYHYFINMLRRMNINIFSRPVKHLPYDRIPGDTFLAPEFNLEIFLGFIVFCFSATFISAWNFYFPTAMEKLLWRCASLYILVFGFWGSFLVSTWDHYFLNRNKAARARRAEITILPDHRQRYKTLHERLEDLANRLRNNSLDQDPRVDMSLTLLVLVASTCSVYAVCRMYIWFEDIFSLRQLPESAFATVNWSKYVPHI